MPSIKSHVEDSYLEKTEDLLIKAAKEFGCNHKIIRKGGEQKTDPYGRLGEYSKTTVTIKLKKWIFPVMKLKYTDENPNEIKIQYGFPHGFSREKTAKRFHKKLFVL